MKYLHADQKFIFHIFPKEKFTDGYITLINKNFNRENHIFWIYGELFQIAIDKEDNVFFLNPKSDWMLYLRLLYKCHGIILHSFTNDWVIKTLFFQPWLFKKLNIVFWGADLYSYRNEKKTTKAKLWEYVRGYIIKNTKYITTLVAGDYELAKQWYKVKGISLRGVYVNSELRINMPDIKKSLKMDQNKKATINIQIGNNAQQSNNHLEAIDLISRFKDHNIKVYIPLSYGGEKEYAMEVVKYGKKIFGDKFIPILEFIPIEKYYEYLNTIDVAIFNNDRQQGMGNINILVFLGCKVYLRSDTSMWKHFTQERGYSLEKIEDISDISFEKLIEIEPADAEKNASIYLKWLSTAGETWDKVFKAMNID